MELVKLSDVECSKIKSGEAITVAAVLGVMAAAVIAVIVYKVFLSNKGSANIGGWKFSWA